jgi:hypothetical protein
MEKRAKFIQSKEEKLEDRILFIFLKGEDMNSEVERNT